METNALLIVDEQPITLNQALKYLQTSGKLSDFIGAILHQHILEQELQAQNQVEVTPEAIEQAILSFRNRHHLAESERFQNWLMQQGMTYEEFCLKTARNLKLNRLIPQVTEPKLHEQFMNKKLMLDRIILSRIVVASQELAEELKIQILEEGISFEQLAREHSLTDDRMMNGMMGAVSRGQLSDGLRAVIDMAQPGDIVGPFPAQEQYWSLFRIEQFLPASLADEQLKQSLRDEIFEGWITDKLQRKQVQLRVA